MIEDESIVASWPAARTLGPVSWEGYLFLGTTHLVFGPIELRSPRTGALSLGVAVASGSVEDISEVMMFAAFDRFADEMTDRTKLKRPVVIPLSEIESVAIRTRAKLLLPGRIRVRLHQGNYAELLVAHQIWLAKFIPPRKHNEALDDCAARISHALLMRP